MKNKKYKIVVLSDMKDTACTTLKSTISLAHMIDADIEFFHVKKPTDIVERDNQLSAIRDINEKYVITEKEIQKVIVPICKEHDIEINYKYAFGNIKEEIDSYIKECQPDIIVLGKRKPKLFKLLGDSITHFILKNYHGVVIIASDTYALEPTMELSLGVLNGEENTFNMDLAKDLMGHTTKPLKSFKIIKNSNASQDLSPVNNQSMIEYVFEQGDNAINNLSKYLSISNVNLLFVDRTDGNSSNGGMLGPDVQTVMDNLNISLLVCGRKSNYNTHIQQQ